MVENCRRIDECRSCGNDDLTSYLDLGDMPLVNNVLTPEQIDQEEKYPLEVVYCDDCGLSQLSTVVDPSILFRDYAYRSSVSRTFIDHCSLLAEKLNKSYLSKNDLVVDIASNDGTLLMPFKKAGNRVLGVDPALNLAEIASESGIPTISEFWGRKGLAESIVKEHGKAKAITAFNVFAHVDDVHGFLSEANLLLEDDGYLIIEAPHLLNLIEGNQFDTVYHEHLSYLLTKPVDRMVRQHGMRLSRVEKQNIHGGSLRYFIEKRGRNSSDGSVEKISREEESLGLYNKGSYYGAKRQFEAATSNLETILRELKSLGKSISGFGASAKGNILLNSCGVGRDVINRIYDDTPEKQGKIYPGVHIPIVSRETLSQDSPDYLVLLSWNFAKEMMEKTIDYKKSGGKYIIPIPHLKIV